MLHFPAGLVRHGLDDLFYFIGLNKAGSQVLLWLSFYTCIDNCILPFPAGLKLGWMTQKIWITWVFLMGQVKDLITYLNVSQIINRSNVH